MCGLLGSTHAASLSREEFSALTDRLAWRGPDASGVWTDGEVWLGHRRLSIVELSEAGAQPMPSACGQYVIAYNGEVYNHLELRARFLPDHRWRGSSDTETILQLFAALGPRFVTHCTGMFAAAIYDTKKKQIFLYRDRFGEKPLYYWRSGQHLVFGSHLDAVANHPAVPKDIDAWALAEYLLCNYIPGNRSIYQGIHKLRPGRWMRFDLSTGRTATERYWSAKDQLQQAPLRPDPEAAADQLEAHLLRAVRGQTLSDRPLGCFLSGGIDSSAVAWALSRVSSGSVRTFTIAFSESEFDESRHARAVADHLATDHTELTATPEQCLDLLPEIPEMFGEPFADASLLPTALLAKLTRQHVTVALSGDGGDELFLGYDRYRWAEKLRAYLRWWPGAPRNLGALLRMVPHHKAQVIARGLSFHSPRDLYPAVFIGWNQEFVQDTLCSLKGSHSRIRLHRNPLGKLARSSPRKSPASIGSFVDLHHYLPDDILVKVDRAAMHASLETRAPFLDHGLAEWALRLDPSLTYAQGTGKAVLKRLLHRHVPQALFERPKAGFAVPLRHWFRGPLRDRLRDALAPERLRQQGLFHAPAVQQLLREHDAGARNHERQLFALLVLQLWWERR